MKKKIAFFFFQSEQEKLHLLFSLYSSPDQQDLLFSPLCQPTCNGLEIFRYDTNYKSDVILKMHFTYPSHLTLPQTTHHIYRDTTYPYPTLHNLNS